MDASQIHFKRTMDASQIDFKRTMDAPQIKSKRVMNESVAELVCEGNLNTMKLIQSMSGLGKAIKCRR